MLLKFESDYRNKILYMSFSESTTITSKIDVLRWRSQWTDTLKSWHSPYKAFIDVSNIERIEDSEEIRSELQSMTRFFKGFFMRKAVGYGHEFGELLPFPTFTKEELAAKHIGIRERKATKKGDFRSLITFENHFRQHVIELTFEEKVKITTREQINILKEKITNNLMQWHSKWNLLIDCTNIESIDTELTDDFELFLKSMKGFFMKTVIGYSPSTRTTEYPFKVYASRHKATAQLESEGLFGGDEADCASKK